MDFDALNKLLNVGTQKETKRDFTEDYSDRNLSLYWDDTKEWVSPDEWKRRHAEKIMPTTKRKYYR